MTAIPAVQAKRFDHMTLISKDLEATRHFYVDLLGLTQTERPAFSFPGLWFQLADVSIHITQESPEAGQSGWADRGVKIIARGHHIAFEVDDCVQAAKILEGKGVKIASPPQTRPDGVRQVYVYDPDAHLVELYSD